MNRSFKKTKISVHSTEFIAEVIGDYGVYCNSDNKMVIVHVPSMMDLCRWDKTVNLPFKSTKVNITKQLKVMAVMCSELKELNIKDLHSPVWDQLKAIVAKGLNEQLF